MLSNNPNNTLHLVVPGQVIAVSSEGEESFLRGHGTYIETSGSTQRLIASVCGTVVRVNKLISVENTSHYTGHVGDLVVGRILSIGNARWVVELTQKSRPATLPLSGIHLPGNVQRIRTAQDAREMRTLLQEGDVLSAEIHKVQQDGTLVLHTRSVHGKLGEGTAVQVPHWLIPRRKHHSVTILEDRVHLLLGCNGLIWLQRSNGSSDEATASTTLELETPPTEPTMPYTTEERQTLARIRNAIHSLRLVQSMITPEKLEVIYHASLSLPIAAMLESANVLALTESFREHP